MKEPALRMNPSKTRLWVMSVSDTNKDGTADAIFFTHPGDCHPEFYVFDLDDDQEPDVMYQDVRRSGSCKDVVEYWRQGQDKPGGDWFI